MNDKKNDGHMTYLAVDRIEDNDMVVLVTSQGFTVNLPVNTFGFHGPKLKTGDLFFMDYDEKATKETQDGTQSIQDYLLSKDDGKDVVL